MPFFPSVLSSASSLCPDPPLVLHPLLQNCKAPAAPSSSSPGPRLVPSGSAQHMPQSGRASPRGVEQAEVPGLRLTQEGGSQCEFV